MSMSCEHVCEAALPQHGHVRNSAAIARNTHSARSQGIFSGSGVRVLNLPQAVQQFPRAGNDLHEVHKFEAQLRQKAMLDEKKHLGIRTPTVSRSTLEHLS